MLDIKEIKEKLTIENLEKHRTWPILLSIFLIGFSMRYLTKHELLFDPDSYWWYQLAMYFAGIRTEHFIHEGGKTIYELAYYPTGRVLETEFLLLPFTIGFSYKLLGTFGAPQTPDGILDYMFFLGPFFGALTAVLVYFVGRELTNSDKAGFIAAIFYSIAHFAMTRNTAGDTGQESLGSLLLFGMLYFFILAIKQTNVKRQVGYASASGILFLLAANTWGGKDFYWGLLASSVLAYLLINVSTNQAVEKYRSICITFPVFFFVGAFIPSLLHVGVLDVTGIMSTGGGAFQNLSYFIVLACLFLLVYEELEKKKKVTIQPRVFFFSAFAAIIIVLLVTGKFIIVERIFHFAYKLILAPEEKALTGQTVAYYRTVEFSEFKSILGPLLLVIPAGFLLAGYDFYKKRDFNSLFMIFFMILGIVAFRWMIRLSYFLAFILPLFLGLSFSRYIDREKKKPPATREKKNVKSEGPSKFNLVIGFAVLLFLLTPALGSSIQSLKSQKFADQSAVPWKDAGEWIKKNTPENALLIHWWDYGYHLQTFAERRTIVDGGNNGPQVEGGYPNRNVDVASAFTSPEEEFYKYIEPYNPENLPIYVLISYPEFGKSGAINFHVSDELFISSFTVPKTDNQGQDQKNIADILQRNQMNTYYIVNYGSQYLVWALIQMDREGNYHPEWSEKVLAKLLPFNTGYGQGVKHFQLVYQNGYVYVYKYI